MAKVNIKKFREAVNFFCHVYTDFLRYVDAVQNGEVIAEEELQEKCELLDFGKEELRQARLELGLKPESNFESLKFALKGSDKTDLLYHKDTDLTDDTVADMMKYFIPFNKKDEVSSFSEEEATRYETSCLLLLVQRGGT